MCCRGYNRREREHKSRQGNICNHGYRKEICGLQYYINVNISNSRRTTASIQQRLKKTSEMDKKLREWFGMRLMSNSTRNNAEMKLSNNVTRTWFNAD